MIALSEFIAMPFRSVWKSIKHNEFVHFWFKGGRNSTKSSFISIAIVLLLCLNSSVEAIIFRKVGESLRGSVFEQMLWAFDLLGLSHKITVRQSPLSITLNTGQRILFRGLDDPTKIKSIKSHKRYFGIAWFEELDEFKGMEEIRKVQQSLIRKKTKTIKDIMSGDAQQEHFGDKFWIFYSYNPPINKNNWTNKESENTRKDRLIHHSTYLEVPREWLSDQFFVEAEYLKQTNERAYKHEFLGIITGTGGIIFPNVVHENISNRQIEGFDNIKQGIDWGYMVDPFVYGKMHYDRKHRILYIYDELFKVGISNLLAYNTIKDRVFKESSIIADSAEPKSIDEMRSYGLAIRGAKKGAGSIEYGIKFLQAMTKIVIDKDRCPNTYREFSSYELEKTADGEFKQNPPDKNNHSIDMVRYALEREMRNRDKTN